MKIFFASTVAALLACSCISTKSEVDVKPIKIVIDVNINIKVEKELEDIFSDLDEAQQKIETGEEK